LKLGVKVKVEDDQLLHEALSGALGWYLGVEIAEKPQDLAAVPNVLGQRILANSGPPGRL
jgi:hypothetical protein